MQRTSDGEGQKDILFFRGVSCSVAVLQLLLKKVKQLIKVVMEQWPQYIFVSIQRIGQFYQEAAPQRILCKRFSTKSRISRFQCA